MGKERSNVCVIFLIVDIKMCPPRFFLVSVTKGKRGGGKGRLWSGLASDAGWHAPSCPTLQDVIYFPLKELFMCLIKRMTLGQSLKFMIRNETE